MGLEQWNRSSGWGVPMLEERLEVRILPASNPTREVKRSPRKLGIHGCARFRANVGREQQGRESSIWHEFGSVQILCYYPVHGNIKKWQFCTLERLARWLGKVISWTMFRKRHASSLYRPRMACSNTRCQPRIATRRCWC